MKHLTSTVALRTVARAAELRDELTRGFEKYHTPYADLVPRNSLVQFMLERDVTRWAFSLLPGTHRVFEREGVRRLELVANDEQEGS